jgi:hypothetical protein
LSSIDQNPLKDGMLSSGTDGACRTLCLYRSGCAWRCAGAARFGHAWLQAAGRTSRKRVMAFIYRAIGERLLIQNFAVVTVEKANLGRGSRGCGQQIPVCDNKSRRGPPYELSRSR